MLSSARSGTVPPEISIIVPSHCRTDLLQACLGSLTAHAPPGTDILVVDDGSPEGAASAMARRAGVRALRLAPRRGFCAAANAGIAAAAGHIVELINDDVEVSRGWAMPALRRFHDPDVASVAPLVLFPPAPGRCLKVDSAGDSYYIGGIARKRFHERSLSGLDLRPAEVFGASACAGFYRRSALLRVGGFPEDFEAYFDDIDLAFRLHRAGYITCFEPASRVFHRAGSSYPARDRRLAERTSCNEELVFWRNLPASLLHRAVLPHLAVLLAKACRRWSEGNLAPFLFGRLRTLTNLAALLRHRRDLAQHFPASSPQAWQIDLSYR
jgi:GT2 family glycosyltransferase